MSIQINNGIANIQGTPGAYTGLFTSAPAATGVSIGTLWLDNTTGAIYQSDGTTWISMGGGGGSQNLQQVLNVGNTATDTSIQVDDTTTGYTSLINTTTNAFRAEIGTYAGYLNPDEFAIVNIGLNSVTIRPNEVVFYNTTLVNNFNFVLNNSAEFYTINGLTQYGLFFGLNSYISDFGDFANVAKGDFLRVDNTNEKITTYMSNAKFGIEVQSTTRTLLGDFNGINNSNYISIDDNLNTIGIYGHDTRIYATYAGLYANLGVTYIGDHDGQNNSTIYGVDDNNQTLYASSNLLVGSSGAVSGQHLKINVGGTNYVIELRNP